MADITINGEPWTLKRQEDEGRTWVEDRKFFSEEQLKRADHDLVAEWVAAWARPGDTVMSDAGYQITLRHYED